MAAAGWRPGGLVLAEEVAVTMRDGCRLATDVIRADGRCRVPALLIRTPYGRASNRTGLDPIALARSGLAVVIQDIRGRWDSDGHYLPTIQDVDDGADAVAWCAEQSWCDGAVIMAGASYDGITAWLAAMARPPQLKGIAPVVSTPHTARALLGDHAAPDLGFLINWGLGHVKIGNHAAPSTEAEATTLLGAWHETVRRPDALVELSRLFPQYAAWSDDHRLLPELTADSPLGREGLPVYQITGWWDIFVEGALAAQRILQHTRSPQRLVVGPWGHGEVFATASGDLDFPPEASGYDRFPAERMEFLRKVARSEQPTGGVSAYVIGADRWLETARWPPPANTCSLALVDNEGIPALGSSSRHESAQLRWHHDPDHPTPTLGGRTLHPGRARPGPVDRSCLPEGDGRCSIRTDPLTGPLTVIGTVIVDLVWESSTMITDLVFTLIDHYPDGRAIGLLSTTHRMRRPTGRIRSNLQVGSIAVEFAAGHRIGLELTSSDFPHHDVTAEEGYRAIHRLELLLPVATCPVSP